VCGLKRRVLFPDFLQCINNYDVFCICESKLDKHDIIDVQGYTYLSLLRNQTVKRKSGGIGIFVKNTLAPYVEILPSTTEYVFFIKVDKCILGLDEPLLIGTIYCPPENSRFYNEDLFDSLSNDITEYCSKFKYVFLNGDINGRISNENDFVLVDDFLSEQLGYSDEVKHFYNDILKISHNDFSLKRTSKDTKQNGIGRKLLDICKNNSLVILNGRFGSDKNIGEFTFKNQSVIDYSICSLKTLEFVKEFEIIDTDTLYSDGHKLMRNVLFSSKLPSLQSEDKHITSINNESEGETSPYIKNPKWKPELKDRFVDQLNTKEINNLITSLNNDDVSKSHIDTVSNKIAQMFSECACQAFPENTSDKKQNLSQPPKKPWFGPNCRNARVKYNQERKNIILTKRLSINNI